MEDTNQFPISITLSAEHKEFSADISDCFENQFQVEADLMRFSDQDLLMQIYIGIGTGLVTNAIYDLLKSGIGKLLKKFSKASLVVRFDGIMFNIKGDKSVFPIIVPERMTEFQNIQNLTQLIVYIRDKSNKSSIPEGWTETCLGRIPSHWNIIKAQDYCSKVADGTHDSPKQSDEGKLLITSKNIKDGRLDTSSAYKISIEDFEEINRRSKVDRWDILLSMIGTVGEICLISEEPDFAIKNVGLFKCGDKWKAKWLYYFLRSNTGRNHILSRLSGTTQKYITLGDLRDFPILFPPPTEQQAIAQILSSFDDKIELLREQNETLEKTAQTIFQEWFGKYSAEDWLAADYQFVGLDEIIEFEPREKVYKYKSYLFYDMKCLTTNSMSLGEGEYKISSSGTSFRVGDTLLAKITPCLENGKTGYVLDIKNEDFARGSTEFIVMRSRKGGSPYYNYCLARSQDFRDHAIKSMTGTSGRQRVQLSLLKNYKVAYCAKSMNQFHDIAMPLFAKIKQNSLQIQSLSKTRDELLPRLMNGEVKTEV